MKKVFLTVAAVVLSLALVCTAVVAALFGNDIRTILSLESYDAPNLYSIEYHGDYGFDEFLEVGAKDWDEYGEYISSTLAHGLAAKLDVSGTSCSAFVCRNEKGEVLFCRNFDYTPSPCIMTTTRPSNGCASISAADFGFCRFGMDEDIEPHKLDLPNALTLASPYFTTDGMNEYGVAMAVLDCGRAQLLDTEGAPTLTTCAMIRMILDKAENTDEAIELFGSCNMSHDKPNHHFMIADSTGRAVVMEYTKDGIVAYESDTVTNFDLYDSLHLGSGHGRYDYIRKQLDEHNGVLTVDEAMDILCHVKVRLQYSTVYNLTTGEVHVFTLGDATNAEVFRLAMNENR